MIHELISTWFHWVEAWGYAGIFILMAMESSVFPVPSEIVLAPAGFWAAQGKLSFAGVVLAGTLGSYTGAIITYYVARWVGLPLVERYGKYVGVSAPKLRAAHDWVSNYGMPGIFFGRLLPVVRHLISIPAGILSMPVGRFTAATITGALLWCTVLSWFGAGVLGSRPELLQSPEAMATVIKAKLVWFVLAVVAFVALWLVTHKKLKTLAVAV